jgi:DNA-binding MurR/RpiR family transcriptional regulator
MAEQDHGVQEWLRLRLGDRQASPGALKVMRALSARAREMAYASTAEAASMSAVNVATVVRCAQLLGFSGWPALRTEARSRYLAGLSASEVLSAHGAETDSPVWSTLRGDLRNLQELSQLLDEEQVGRVARLIGAARTTLVLGSGSFAAPGLQLAHLAQTVGYDVRLHREGGTSLINAAKLLGEQDCLVVMRLWRSPLEIMDAASVAKRQGAAVVVVADRAGTDVLRVADELVVVPSEGASMFPSITASVTVVNAVMAALVALDEERARAHYDRAEELWTEFGLFPGAHDG